MRTLRLIGRRERWRTSGIAVAGLVLASLSVIVLKALPPGSQPTTQARIRRDGPWVFGAFHAPFTIIEYADLECPYCRAYFPVLERWIKEHPQVNWEWWNLPLAMHDPAASREALLAECVGEADGNGAFWQTVAWIYQNTRSDGAGIATSTHMPEESPAVRGCLEAGSAEAVIRVQTAEALQQHIEGTPTLRILDHRTGRSLELQGPVPGDTLLSAVDWLAAKGAAGLAPGGPRRSRLYAHSRSILPNDPN